MTLETKLETNTKSDDEFKDEIDEINHFIKNIGKGNRSQEVEQSISGNVSLQYTSRDFENAKNYIACGGQPATTAPRLPAPVGSIDARLANLKLSPSLDEGNGADMDTSYPPGHTASHRSPGAGGMGER
jgi:hypothetical protein